MTKEDQCRPKGSAYMDAVSTAAKMALSMHVTLTLPSSYLVFTAFGQFVDRSQYSRRGSYSRMPTSCIESSRAAAVLYCAASWPQPETITDESPILRPPGISHLARRKYGLPYLESMAARNLFHFEEVFLLVTMTTPRNSIPPPP